MNRLTRIGTVMFAVGITLLLVTALRGNSSYGLSCGVHAVKPNYWYKTLDNWLCFPRDLTLEIQTNATVDVYFIDAEGIRLWEANETRILKPLFAFEGIKHETFNIKPNNRDVFSLVFHNPSDVPAAVEVTLWFSGVERDLLLVSFAFVGAGLIVIAFAFVLNSLRPKAKLRKSNLPSEKQLKNKGLL